MLDAAQKVDLLILCAAVAGKPYTLSPQVRSTGCYYFRELYTALLLVDTSQHPAGSSAFPLLHLCACLPWDALLQGSIERPRFQLSDHVFVQEQALRLLPKVTAVKCMLALCAVWHHQAE